jgi:predicted nucleotide-binding protein (sugar kinase/HSP70/actin superfamily)
MIKLINFQNIKTNELACNGCNNRCTVLRFRFPNGNTSYTGNKCEKVFFNSVNAVQKGFNAFDLKNELLFNSARITQREQANTDKNIGESPSDPLRLYTKKRIGIPRILNMYENFPFWKTLFEEYGFETVLSPESSVSLYQRGVGSVMSDNICFPAKVAHGHILALIDTKPDRIFYPIIPKEDQEFKDANNSFNCPVVSGYPEVIRSSINPAGNYEIPFDKPVMNLADEKVLKKQCCNYLFSITDTTFDADLQSTPNNNVRITNPREQKQIKRKQMQVFERAFEKANFIRKNYNHPFIENQIILLKNSIKSGDLTFIVAGRPYHADPLVNQKVGQILSDLGVNVLTDDVFREEREGAFRHLNLVSQWAYPNRVVQTASAIAKLPQNIQMIQLNSFGCGPDSFFMEETGEILRQANKNYTVLRIDEISSSGSIRLRLRSLIESLKARNKMNKM